MDVFLIMIEEKHSILYSFERDDKGSGFGSTHIFRGPGMPQYVNHVHLLQPFNAWAAEHFNPKRADDDARVIVSLLHAAYEAGRESMKKDIHQLLSLNDKRR